MTTKTDYHALKELQNIYHPVTRGIVTENEARTICNVLELDVRNDIELQNIRDMAVMLYSERAEQYRADGDINIAIVEIDAMSAVCAVIDREKVKRRLEV